MNNKEGSAFYDNSVFQEAKHLIYLENYNNLIKLYILFLVTKDLSTRYGLHYSKSLGPMHYPILEFLEFTELR